MAELIEITELPQELTILRRAYDGRLKPLQVNPNKKIIICADSRNPPTAFSDGSHEVHQNAGNLDDLESLGKNQEGTIVAVIGHYSEKGKGCGACHEAKEHGHKSVQELSKVLTAGLVDIVKTAKPTPEDNLIQVVSRLQAKKYKVLAGLVDNYTLKIDWLETKDPELIKFRKEITAINEKYRKSVHPETLKQYKPEELKNAQNPGIIHLSTHPHSFAHIFGGIYGRANEVFESKGNSWSRKLTGTGEYSLNHALHGHGSFNRSGLALLSSDDVKKVRTIVDSYEGSPIMIGYKNRKGKLYAFAENKQDGLRFYKINFKQ